MRLPIFLAVLALAAAPAVNAFAAPGAAAPAARAPQPGEAEYTPDGAPRDDYNFTAWCRGVLEGHMALAEHVKSVLPLDEVQQKIGAAYLKGYDEALRIGKKGRSDAEIDAAEAIRFAARANWNTAMQADLQLGADTYLAWQLPGRCEHAAKRVAKRDDIFNLAPSTDDVEAMGSNMSANDAPVGRAAAPAMTPAPQPAPAPPVAEVAAPAVEPAPMEAPASPEAVSVDALTMGSSEPAMTEDAPADDAGMAPDQAAVDTDALTTGASQPADEAAAPAEAPTVVAAQPVAPAPAPAATTTTTSDGKLVHMPRKGRLFPWSKRE